MRVILLTSAALALLAVTGCTEYPAAIQTSMAQAVPPYHQANDVDMNKAAGLVPVEDATHNFSIRVSPFTN